MAQTKRKRRTKHRGNAAGNVESRGRTGPNLREERRFQEPTWTGAATRAGLASLMLFVLFISGIAGQEQNVASAIALAAGAFLIYVPIGYKVDRMFWERRMRKAGRALPQRAPKKGKS